MPEEPPRPGRRAKPSNVFALLGVAFTAACLAVLWAALDTLVPSAQKFALSPQDCNTECQSRQTDCIEDCDGHLQCEHRCVETGKACVERCARAARADAGVGGAAGAGGRGGRGGAGGRGNAGRPAAGAGGAPKAR
jgi:hypothetical protein